MHQRQFGTSFGLVENLFSVFFMEAHNSLQKISRKSGIRVRNPFENAMVLLLWLGIASNHILGALDAILKKCWGLLKTKYDEKCDNFGDFGGFIDF